MAFFAFFVLVGSVYHVTAHKSVTYAIESLQPDILKGLDNETYDDTDKKQAADDSEKGAKLVDESSHEAGVEASTTESNGITQLVIQDEREGEQDKKTNNTRGGLGIMIVNVTTQCGYCNRNEYSPFLRYFFQIDRSILMD